MVEIDVQLKRRENRLKRAKDLADAVSAQAQIANRFWFSMTTVALFAVLPRDISNKHTINLPFGLGEVAVSAFYTIIYPLMIILVIAFSSTHAQQLSAQNLAQNTLNRMGHDKEKDGIDFRIWFDMWRKPSLNRVAPLPLALGDAFPTRGMSHVIRLYYSILKVVALGIYFVFPLWALWYVYVYRLDPNVGPVTTKLFLFGACLATLTLIQVICSEISYAVRAGSHISAKPIA